jgi:hypothetical protein
MSGTPDNHLRQFADVNRRVRELAERLEALEQHLSALINTEDIVTAPPESFESKTVHELHEK